MRTLLLIISAFLTSATLFAQKNKISENDAPDGNFYCTNLILDKQVIAERAELPYSEIVVVDARPDTSKCGYWYSRQYSRYMKLCCPGGTQQELSLFLNSHLKNNFNPSGNRVLACIKKCWTNTDGDPSAIRTSLKIEFYLEKDAVYYPLYRYDEAITEDYVKKSTPDQYIGRMLIASTKKLYSPKTITPGMKSLSYAEIDSFNHLVLSLPVLQTEKPAKGVYMDFKQFKNNQPAYTEFELDMGKTSDALFVKGKNLKDSAITDNWGFSDGENIFVRIKTNFFLLFRHGNTFDLYGFDKITQNQPFPTGPDPYVVRSDYLRYGAPTAAAGAVTGLLGMIRSKSKNLKPYQLNMENGELY